MSKKITAVIAVAVAAVIIVTVLIFSPKAIRIDFDSVVDEMHPVHNIGRMPDYGLNSEMNSYFTQANMTSCRTHDIRCF